MEGVFLKNEGATHVQVGALGAFFDLPPGVITQITNPFRGTKSPHKDYTDDQIADLIIDELTPRGGPAAGQTKPAVRRLSDEETATLVDDDGVLTEKEQAKTQRRRARTAKRTPKGKRKK